MRHTHTLVNQIWGQICEINKSALFNLVVANPCRGFGLSDKQNGRTAMYCSLSPFIYCLMSWVIKQVCANHTIWQLMCGFCRRIQPYDLWFLCTICRTIWWTTFTRFIELFNQPHWMNRSVKIINRINTIFPNLRHLA